MCTLGSCRRECSSLRCSSTGCVSIQCCSAYRGVFYLACVDGVLSPTCVSRRRGGHVKSTVDTRAGVCSYIFRVRAGCLWVVWRPSCCSQHSRPAARRQRHLVGTASFVGAPFFSVPLSTLALQPRAGRVCDDHDLSHPIVSPVCSNSRTHKSICVHCPGTIIITSPYRT